MTVRRSHFHFLQKKKWLYKIHGQKGYVDNKEMIIMKKWKFDVCYIYLYISIYQWPPLKTTHTTKTYYVLSKMQLLQLKKKASLDKVVLNVNVSLPFDIFGIDKASGERRV